MQQITKKFCLSVIIFAAFSIIGFVASNIPYVHDSLVASTAFFGISFISVIGGIAKFWYNFFN